MRRALGLLVIVVVAVACSDALREGSSWPATIDLPRVATIGDLPRAGTSCVIAIDREGNASVDGRAATDPRDVVDRLRERVGPKTGFVRDRAGTVVDVVLALDGDAPWRSAAAILQSCCDPQVDAGRVHFAVRGLDGGEPGGFVLVMPLDFGGSSPLKPPGPEEAQQVVGTIAPGEGATPDALAAWLTARPLRPRCTEVALDAPPDAPVRFVLAVLDAARRGGADQANASVTRPRPGGPRPDADRPYFQRLAASPGPWHVVVRGAPALPAPGPAPRPPRVRGGQAGFTAPWTTILFLADDDAPR